MKQTVYRLAVLAFSAALPAVAAADVQLYGTIRSGVTVSQTKTENGRHTRSSVSDLDSYIGMRGSHPIGGQAAPPLQSKPVSRSGGSLREYFRDKKNGASFGAAE